MDDAPFTLNYRAAVLCDEVAASASALGTRRHLLPSKTTVFDFGIDVPGSEAAALLLARICLADLAKVSLLPGVTLEWAGRMVAIETDRPVAACMAAQYAGWEIKSGEFFAMGSGPMRAAAGREPLFDDIGYREQADRCVGVLESGKLPPDEVCCEIAAKCGIEPSGLTLLVAPTSSLAGTLQVVARSVETALHKLHELGFELARVVRGQGSAPLPPVAEDDLAGIGVTNDAILYGGRVLLEVTGDDASLEEIGPQSPSSASSDYGRPFVEVLASYGNDFYRVDPLLFSAAQITLVNVDTGNRFQFGELNIEVLKESFGDN